MNADAPRKRILPSFPDLVKELSQTSFAAKEDIERVAREVVTEELNRIKQGSSPRGMDALVGKAQRLLDPPPPPTGASILDEGDPFLETTGSHDLRGIWDRKTPLIGEESGTEILPVVPALEAAAALPAPAIVAVPSGFGRAPLEADDSSVFGPLPDVEAQRTSVLPPPQTPLPPPYAGLVPPPARFLNSFSPPGRETPPARCLLSSSTFPRRRSRRASRRTCSNARWRSRCPLRESPSFSSDASPSSPRKGPETTRSRASTSRPATST